MLGLIPILFFIQSLLTRLQTIWTGDNHVGDNHKAHTSATSQTKRDYALRRDQPGCACPQGKSLPLTKAYPAPESESMGGYPATSGADAGTARVRAHSRRLSI